MLTCLNINHLLLFIFGVLFLLTILVISIKVERRYQRAREEFQRRQALVDERIEERWKKL